MVNTGARPERRTRADIPDIAIVTGTDNLPTGPLTIFAVELLAGAGGNAAMAVKSGDAGEAIISLRARAGAVARFVPAAPAFIRVPLHVEISGAGAVGTVAFR